MDVLLKDPFMPLPELQTAPIAIVVTVFRMELFDTKSGMIIMLTVIDRILSIVTDVTSTDEEISQNTLGCVQYTVASHFSQNYQ